MPTLKLQVFNSNSCVSMPLYFICLLGFYFHFIQTEDQPICGYKVVSEQVKCKGMNG